MQYEMPVYADGIGKAKQTAFRGLNHNPGAGDGQIYEMKNLCSDYFPLLATRPRRADTGVEYEDVPDALFTDDAVYAMVNGSLYRNGILIGSAGSEEESCMAKLNGYIVMMPGKTYYNEASGETGSLESEVSIMGGTGTLEFLSPYVGRVTATDDETVVISCPVIMIDDKVFPQLLNHAKLEAGITVKQEYLGETDWEGTITEIDSGYDEEEEEGYYRVTVHVTSGDAHAGEGRGPTTVVDLYITGLRTITYEDGTLYAEDAEANTIYCPEIDWRNYFRAGDAVTISGSYYQAANTSLIIREIDDLNGHELHFYENSFPFVTATSGPVTETSGTWMIKRVVPDMDGIFESGNRLWGWKDKTIYVSKLGDPFNWNVFDGLETDSWAVEVGGVGEFTGGIEYQGYPTFFREWDLYKVFGNVPSNYELIRTAETGIKKGSTKSLAVAGETLFYHNRNGIYAYAGGSPTKVSAALGTTEYEHCVGGSDGQKYYCSMCERGKDPDEIESWHLFVYDTGTGQWHEEDNVRATGFSRYGNQFLMAAQLEGSYDGEPVSYGIFSIGHSYYETENLEDSFDWYAEFCDFTDDSPNKKGISKLQIRLEMDEGSPEDPSSVTVKIMMDSDGEWVIPAGGVIEETEKRSYILPIIPRRADHYKLRIEGHGGCRIYSIAREYYQGSDLKSKPGRQ